MTAATPTFGHTRKPIAPLIAHDQRARRPVIEHATNLWLQLNKRGTRLRDRCQGRRIARIAARVLRSHHRRARPRPPKANDRRVIFSEITATFQTIEGRSSRL